MSKKFLSVVLAATLVAGVFSTVPAISAAENSKVDTKTSSAKLYGDVDGSGSVDVKDATMLQKYLAGASATVESDLSDVNSDGAVDIADGTYIQKYINHTYSMFPAVKDNDWRTSSIGYEIFVRSFYDSDGDGCGDFRGVAEKADYLKSLNVGVVWLMPFNKTGSYHGYDIQDYKQTCSDYGTMEDLEYMLETLHKNNIKVVMDLVVNHTSDQHQWFKNAYGNVDGYKDFYVNSTINDKNAPNNWFQKSGLWWYSCFKTSSMPDLNYNNKAVWNAVDDVADFWLDKGIDGFRLDAAMHIDDSIVNGNHVDGKEGSVTHEWWQHFEQHVKDKNPDAFCIGEVWPETNMKETQAKFFADFDSDFDFYQMSDIKSYAKGTKFAVAKDAQNYINKIKEYAYSTPDVDKITINSLILGNHDVNRVASELGGDSSKIKFAAAVEMLLPGMPWIYYGDEIGQLGTGTSGADDPNRREAMDWFTAKTGTGMTKMNAVTSWGATEKFTKANDGISVEEQTGVDGSVLEYYRTLTSIRNKYKIFYTGTCGDYKYVNGAYVYSISDECRDYSVEVLHNYSKATTLTPTADFTDLISGKEYKAGETYDIALRQSIVAVYTDEQPF